MIAYITGVLAYKDTDSAIVETGGIGYELSMSLHSLAALPQTGQPVQVWTVMSVKEDDVSLYGFLDPAEKQLFEQLITISGVGPKIALSALSTYKPVELIAAIGAGDVTAISKISGIGKKTAQRMILELQGLLKTDDSVDALLEDSSSKPLRDAALALEGMGFSSQEVAEALKGCTLDNASDIVRFALKHMGGR